MVTALETPLQWDITNNITRERGERLNSISMFQPVVGLHHQVQPHHGDGLLSGGAHLPPALRQPLHGPPPGQGQAAGSPGEGGEVGTGILNTRSFVFFTQPLNITKYEESVFALVGPLYLCKYNFLSKIQLKLWLKYKLYLIMIGNFQIFGWSLEDICVSSAGGRKFTTRKSL